MKHFHYSLLIYFLFIYAIKLTQQFYIDVLMLFLIVSLLNDVNFVQIMLKLAIFLKSCKIVECKHKFYNSALPLQCKLLWKACCKICCCLKVASSTSCTLPFAKKETYNSLIYYLFFPQAALCLFFEAICQCMEHI